MTFLPKFFLKKSQKLNPIIQRHWVLILLYIVVVLRIWAMLILVESFPKMDENETLRLSCAFVCLCVVWLCVWLSVHLFVYQKAPGKAMENDVDELLAGTEVSAEPMSERVCYLAVSKFEPRPCKRNMQRKVHGKPFSS